MPSSVSEEHPTAWSTAQTRPVETGKGSSLTGGVSGCQRPAALLADHRVYIDSVLSHGAQAFQQRAGY